MPIALRSFNSHVGRVDVCSVTLRSLQYWDLRTDKCFIALHLGGSHDHKLHLRTMHIPQHIVFQRSIPKLHIFFYVDFNGVAVCDSLIADSLFSQAYINDSVLDSVS